MKPLFQTTSIKNILLATLLLSFTEASLSNSFKDELNSPSLNILGIQRTFSITDKARAEKKIKAFWEVFNSMEPLHNHAVFKNGVAYFYAYYEVNDDFTEADLLLGYNSRTRNTEFVSRHVRMHILKRFSFNPDGSIPDTVWEEAYPHNVIERYSMTKDGQWKPIDILIVSKNKNG